MVQSPDDRCPDPAVDSVVACSRHSSSESSLAVVEEELYDRKGGNDVSRGDGAHRARNREPSTFLGGE